MMRRFNYLKRTLLFALALTLTNCQVDETPTEQQSRIETVTINEAKTLLIQPSTAKFSKLSKEELSNLEFDKISQEKINGSDQLLTIIPYATNDKTINKRILLLRIDKEIKSVVFSMYPEENSQKDHFSGKIFTYSLDGDFINGFRAKDGIIVSQFVKNNNAIKTNTENDKTSKSMHRSAVQLNEVIIQNNYRTVDALDVYGSSGIFGSGLFDGGFDNYYGGGDTSYSWDPGSSSGEANSVANSIEQNIDDKALDACAKAIMEKLKNATNADIASIFVKLEANSLYTVTMKMGAMEHAEDFAETVKTSKNNYSIIVAENSYSGATTLYKAQALLHEIIHAYFRSVVDDYNNNYPTNAPFADFPILYQKYIEKTYPNNSDADHEAMANKYVDAIAFSLQQYDTNYSVPYQVYSDLAWAGLRDTPEFDKKFPEGSAERMRVLARFRAEQNGVYSEGQYALGKPCK